MGQRSRWIRAPNGRHHLRAEGQGRRSQMFFVHLFDTWLGKTATWIEIARPRKVFPDPRPSERENREYQAFCQRMAVATRQDASVEQS